MKLNIKDLTILRDVACEAALAAGNVIKTSRAIISEFGESIDVKLKTGGSTIASQVVTKVDLESQTAILSYIQPTLEQFDLALLSEELEDNGSRFQKDYFWAIDPLDGTLPFIEGKDGHAVSIALISREGEALIGVIFDPATDTLYHAIRGNGAFRNEQPLQIQTESSHLCYIIVDRSLKLRLDQSSLRDDLSEIFSNTDLSIIEEYSFKGAVMNACQTMENGLSCYFKPPKKEEGGGCIWDFGATSCIFTEAGGVVTDCSGKPLELNSSTSLYMNRQGVIFATTKELSQLCVIACCSAGNTI